jgi:hypothetical protein
MNVQRRTNQKLNLELLIKKMVLLLASQVAD